MITLPHTCVLRVYRVQKRQRVGMTFARPSTGAPPLPPATTKVRRVHGRKGLLSLPNHNIHTQVCPFPSHLAEVIRSRVHGDASSKCQNWGRVATAPLPRALLCHSGSLVPLHFASSRRVAELLPHTSRPPWQRVTLCKAWPSHYPPLQHPTHSQTLLFGVLPLLVQTPATRRAKKGESVLSLNGSPLGPVATTALSTPAVAVELSTGHVITTAEASVCVCV